MIGDTSFPTNGENRGSKRFANSAPTVFSRYAKNLLLCAGTLVVLFIVLELVLRMTYRPENLDTIVRFDRRLGWSLSPNKTLRCVDRQRDLDYLVKINSLGMRDADVPSTKHDGTRRILIIGDSIAFGTGVDAERRFSDFLRRALERDGVEVFNAGVCGWGNDQELIHYEGLGRRLHPDIVVLTMTIANDVLNNGLDHLFLGSAPKPRFILEGDSLLLHPDPLSPLKPTLTDRTRSLFRKSRTLLFVKRRIDVIIYQQRVAEELTHHELGFGKEELEKNCSHWSVYETTYLPRFEQAWRVTEAILARFAELCREDGVDLIVFAYPLKVEVDEEWRGRLLKKYEIDPGLFDFSKPYRRLEAICDKQGVTFCYPLGTFKSASESRALYFEKDSHPNAYGHALAAQVLLGLLQDHYSMKYRIAATDQPYLDAVH